MPLLNDWKLTLDADQVLRAQGADPAMVRARRPALARLAEQALDAGQTLLTPAAVFVEIPVRAVRHEQIQLESPEFGRLTLSGKLLASHLAAAEKLAAVVCTVGKALEDSAAEQMAHDPLMGLALDAVGSAAAEALANAVCAHLEARAAQNGLQVSLPLSPGMIDWPVDEGQPQIFLLLDAEQERLTEPVVTLTPEMIMLPRKSVSFVIGLGSQMEKQGKTCDFCAMKETCRYQDHYV